MCKNCYKNRCFWFYRCNCSLHDEELDQDELEDYGESDDYNLNGNDDEVDDEEAL